MRTSWLIIVILTLTTSLACAADAPLAWGPSIPTNSVAGYKIYDGHSSRNYTNSIDVGNTLTGTVVNVSSNVNTYFAVTAYNHRGDESDFSNEVILDTERLFADIDVPPADAHLTKTAAEIFGILERRSVIDVR